MASISSLSGEQSVAQSGLQQIRLQQAERNAQQAERTARDLRAEARDAQQKAGEAEDEARSITSEADQAQADAGKARQGLAAVKGAARLSDAGRQGTEGLKIAEPATPSRSLAPPVINTRGQLTGTVINTTA